MGIVASLGMEEGLFSNCRVSLWQRFGVQFPQRPPDAAPIFTPPATHAVSRPPQIGYGMPSTSTTRLDEAMAADDNLRFGLDLAWLHCYAFK